MRYYVDKEEVLLIFVAMHIDVIPNRKSRPAILLRESYREDGKVKKRTLANLSMLPMAEVSSIKMRNILFIHKLYGFDAILTGYATG